MLTFDEMWEYIAVCNMLYHCQVVKCTCHIMAFFNVKTGGAFFIHGYWFFL